jgi:iron(III) transport system ATP-binding protein
MNTFGKVGRGAGEFIYPVAIAKNTEENLYVGGYGSNDRIQKFTSDGDHLLTFGGFGAEPGQFQRPSGIVWHEGIVYVADSVNNRIQAFKDDGTFLKIIAITHEGASVSLHLPYDLALDVDGRLFVVEYGAGRILQCSLHGELLGVCGKQGSANGQFSKPWGVTVDSRGAVRVADTGNRRLVAISP